MKICLLTRFHTLHQQSTFVARLLQEAHNQGHHLDLINPQEVSFAFEQKEFPLRYQGRPFPEYDLIHYATRWDDQHTWSIVDALGNSGRKVLPSARVPLGDSITMARLFSRKEIHTPRTWIFGRVDELLVILPELKFPCLFRMREGGRGRKLNIANHSGEALTFAETSARLGQSFMVQEMPEPTGEDIRVMVIGTEVICAIRRKAPAHFIRPREDNNASAEVIELTAAEKAMAVAASQVYAAPYAAISLLRTPDGDSLMLELSRAPALDEMERVTGINIASKIMTYCVKKASEIS